MSYDLHLYPKKGELIKSGDLKNLGDKFGYKISELDSSENVKGFYVAYKNEFESRPPDQAWEIYYQGSENGYYWTCISWGASQSQFENFFKLVSEVCFLLGLKLVDPQLSGASQKGALFEGVSDSVTLFPLAKAYNERAVSLIAKKLGWSPAKKSDHTSKV